MSHSRSCLFLFVYAHKSKEGLFSALCVQEKEFLFEKTLAPLSNCSQQNQLKFYKKAPGDEITISLLDAVEFFFFWQLN